MKVVNDGEHDSLMSWSLELFKVLEKATIAVIVKVQENEKDLNCVKDFFRTTVDLQKLFKGAQGSFVAKVLMENFFTSIDFEPKFPFEKVRNYIF